MRRSQMRKALSLLLLLFVQCTFLRAQNIFRYKANLSAIQQSGFYNISLSPDIIAKCKSDLGDVRIKDNNSAEISYILYTETARLNEDSFTEFPVTYSDNRTSLVISNILPNSISRLFLLIKNSEAQRAATLSGSDDTAHWFVIKENIILQNEYTADSDAFVQSVSFPPSSYKYFHITMQGKNILPLNIVKAGVYRQSSTSNVFDSLPLPLITQKDSSDKKSYVYLSFDEAYGIDKINLQLSGAKYYRRAIAVYDKNTNGSLLVADTLLSGKPAIIELHAKTNRLLLVISNSDNTPIKVENATVLGLHTSVTAYLNAGKQYALYFGDLSAIAPTYDLQYFNDSIGNDIQPLAIKSIELIKLENRAKPEVADRSNWLLWGVIIFTLLLLLYFSFRMIRDINNKTKNDADL